MSTITYNGTLTVVTCWCGMRHAIPTELREHQLRHFHDGSKPVDIYCPLGHTYIPAGEGEAERLQRRLDRETERADAERDLRKDTERRLVAQKAATTRAKTRHANGVCPVCKRSFKQVTRHMASQHPDYRPTP